MSSIFKNIAILFTFWFASYCSADSIYTVTTQTLHTSFLQYQNKLYDVTFSYNPGTNRLKIESLQQRVNNALPVYGEPVEVSESLHFTLPRIQAEGALYRAEIEYRQQQNDFEIVQLDRANNHHAQRGQIVSTEKIASFSQDAINFLLLFSEQEINSAAKYGVDLYKIVYETLDPAGELTQASALIGIPTDKNTSYPLLSYQHATIVENSAAPSNSDPHFPTLLLTAQGFYTVSADYLGFGVSPPLHPSVNALTLASSSIDAIRAARLFAIEDNVQLNAQLFLMGYSEGGYATLALQRQIQHYHADEFNITASAAMAGPYDLSGVMKQHLLDSLNNPYYFPFQLLGNNQIYGFFEQTQDVFTASYADSILSYFDGSLDSEQINQLLPEDIQSLVTDDFFSKIQDNSSFFSAVLIENDLYRWVPQAKTRLYHCEHDIQVPFANSQLAYDSFVAAGASDIELITVPDVNANLVDLHFYCAIPALLMANEWFNELRQ